MQSLKIFALAGGTFYLFSLIRAMRNRNHEVGFAMATYVFPGGWATTVNTNINTANIKFLEIRAAALRAFCLLAVCWVVPLR